VNGRILAGNGRFVILFMVGSTWNGADGIFCFFLCYDLLRLALTGGLGAQKLGPIGLIGPVAAGMRLAEDVSREDGITIRLRCAPAFTKLRRGMSARHGRGQGAFGGMHVCGIATTTMTGLIRLCLL